HRGPEHARADVGLAGELEQALHRPVLPERSVEDGDNDVDLRECCDDAVRRGRNRQVFGRRSGFALQFGARRSSRERPGAVAADLDGHRVVAGRVERIDDRAGRGQRDLVLARPAAGDDRDPAPVHGAGGGGGGGETGGGDTGWIGTVSVGVVSVGGGATYCP